MKNYINWTDCSAALPPRERLLGKGISNFSEYCIVIADSDKLPKTLRYDYNSKAWHDANGKKCNDILRWAYLFDQHSVELPFTDRKAALLASVFICISIMFITIIGVQFLSRLKGEDVFGFPLFMFVILIIGMMCSIKFVGEKLYWLIYRNI
jgi:hypothetical protein